jgi:hypothetical protein
MYGLEFTVVFEFNGCTQTEKVPLNCEKNLLEGHPTAAIPI